MTDMTNVHAGSVPLHGNPLHVGPLTLEDERALVQVFFDMIMQEQELERQKQTLVEQSDFNTMDCFQMMDEKSLGWVSAP